MSEPTFEHVSCPVLVLRVTTDQVMGDGIADALRDEFLAASGQAKAVNVVIDFSDVVYLSSAGIRPLLALNRAVREREGRLVLCGLQENVEEVLLATRLISSNRSSPATFERQATVPAAVASLYATGEVAD